MTGRKSKVRNAWVPAMALALSVFIVVGQTLNCCLTLRLLVVHGGSQPIPSAERPL